MVLSSSKVVELTKESYVRDAARVLRHRDYGHSGRPDSLGLIPSSERTTLDFQEGGTFLRISPSLKDNQLGVSSVDLRLGTIVAWSDKITQGVTYEDLMDMPHKVLENGEQFTFQSDPDGEKVYYVTTLERISHSSDLEVAVDSKSTTGRVGCMTHHAGFLRDGRLVTILQPYAFNLTATCGKTSLSQACFRFRASPYVQLEEIQDSGVVSILNGMPIRDSVNSRGLLLSFSTSLAYRARENQEPIDMDGSDLNWRNYFDVVEGSDRLPLGKKNLYLLGSREEIRLADVMGRLSREDDVLTGSGSWGHFAGFIQPHFQGQITLEFYAFTKRELREGDNAGVIRFDRVQGKINEQNLGSYHGQRAPRLPRMFKAD